MGISHSKKSTQVQQIDNIARNDNNNENNSDNNVCTKNVFDRIDRQVIDTIKADLLKTPDLFVLNNIVMCVMFFDEYKQYKIQETNDCLKESEFLIPDKILEKVNDNVLCRPHHGPKKFESEPLLAKRIFVLSDAIKVIGTNEDVEDNEQNNGTTTARIEKSPRKGFVRLRELNIEDVHSSSDIPGLDSTESLSRCSTDSSDTTYATFKNLKTPKPIDIIKCLESKSEYSGLSRTSVSYRKIKKLWNMEDVTAESISEDDLFETVSYVNSKKFMMRFVNDLFLDTVATKLGLSLEDIEGSKYVQQKILCKLAANGHHLPCEIIPGIKADWPSEQTLKFLMKGNRTASDRKTFIFPTSTMIEEVKNLGCVLLPKGYLYKNTERADAEIEWELSFPQAQEYLETYMTHAQMKSLLIILTLHKTYIEPKTKGLGLNAEHIRNFLLLECESNYSAWPEHRLGTKLVSVLKNLNSNLSNAHPSIPDFFVTDKNTLSEVPTRKIRVAQKIFDEIIQAPVMYFIKALRNLRYVNGRGFFPPLDFKRLDKLLRGSDLQVVHTSPERRTLPEIRQSHYAETELILRHVIEEKRRLKILKEREAEKERENNLNDERKGSVDSIDVDWVCDKKFDYRKKRKVLKLFIDSFLEIAEKCLEISSKTNTLFYIKQAYYLKVILQEECPDTEDDAFELSSKISLLEQRCAQKDDVKNQVRAATFIEPNKNIKISCKTNTNNKKGQNSNQPRKSVAFVETPARTT